MFFKIIKIESKLFPFKLRQYLLTYKVDITNELVHLTANNKHVKVIKLNVVNENFT